MRPLFEKHHGRYSFTETSSINHDGRLGQMVMLTYLTWRAATARNCILKKQQLATWKWLSKSTSTTLPLLVAFVKAGVELAFEVMTESGMKDLNRHTMNHCTKRLLLRIQLPVRSFLK
jgi:ketol-acid reductoisomerase